MSARVMLAAVAVLVVAGVVFLVIKLRGEQEAEPKTNRTQVRASKGERRVRQRQPGAPRLAERPRIDDTTDGDEHIGGRKLVGGRYVRDHRTDAPSPSQPKVRVAKQKVGALHKTLRPAVRECAKLHPPKLTGARSRLTVQLEVDITGERLGVHDAKIAAQGAEDTGALFDCVRQKVMAVQMEASGQPDVSGYKISMGFVLRGTRP